MIRRKKIVTKPPKTETKGLKILFADDERSLQELMRLELPRMGHQVTVCPDGVTAVTAMEKNSYDCLILDLAMPGLNGIEVIARARQMELDCECVVLTGKSSLDTAISALRHGAFDYLTKPCKLVEIEALLTRVAAKRELTKMVVAARHRLTSLEGTPKLVGDSQSMQHVRSLIGKVAPTNSTVLILGETGTGKELVARAVHEQSHRAEKPFVAINCGALPESLIESELFGHRKGSFTGADEHRVGLLEVADGGTLFLDEIGELPKAMQAKLLRVLESGEIRRVGDNTSFTVDVRVVCATHRQLDQMVHQGDFREDLMYRINTFEILVPPLRERIEDIEPLARHLLKRLRPTARPADVPITVEAIETLREHIWSGNVRELANVLEHATILCDEPPIGIEHLPQRTTSQRPTAFDRPNFGKHTLREIEIEAIHAALDRHNGNKPKAAEQLGVSLKTMYNKLNQASTMGKSA